MGRKRRRIDPGQGLPAPLPFREQIRAESSDPGAELRLRGLPGSTTEVDLQQMLETLFRREEYLKCTDGTTVNFSVKLHPHVCV